MSEGTANCKRCKETPVPGNFGSPRKCAFDSGGIFTHDNWNCVTANELRELAREGWGDSKDSEFIFVRRNDQSYAAMWIPPHPEDVPDGEQIGPFRGGGFIAMTWYKHRGQTGFIFRVDPRDGGMPDQAGLPLTVREAEAAIENLTIYRKVFDPRAR